MLQGDLPGMSRVLPISQMEVLTMKFKSQIVTQASGSVGGTTYASNQGGLYMRARSTPTNPNSAFQQAVRTFFKQCMNAWTNTLTSVQRAGWNAYATNTPITNTLGDARKIGDNAMYARSNVSRLQAGLTRIDAPPTTYDLGQFTQPTFTTSINASSLAVAFTTGDAWHTTNGGLLIYASRPQNASVNYFKGPFRLVGVVGGAATSPATFTLPFSAGPATSVIFMKTVATQPDGRLSTPSIVKSTPV